MNHLPAAPRFDSSRSVRILADDGYRVLLDGHGVGFSWFRNTALTPPWPSRPSGGSRFFFQEPETGLVWSSDVGRWTTEWTPGVVSVSGEANETATLRKVCLVRGLGFELHCIALRNLSSHTRRF